MVSDFHQDWIRVVSMLEAHVKQWQRSLMNISVMVSFSTMKKCEQFYIYILHNE